MTHKQSGGVENRERERKKDKERERERLNPLIYQDESLVLLDCLWDKL